MQFFLSQSIPDNAFQKIEISLLDLTGPKGDSLSNHIQYILQDLLVKFCHYSSEKEDCKN